MWDRLRKWWRGFVSSRKPRISFQVSVEEKLLIEHWARREGVTVSEFLRDAVAKSIPTEERRKFESRWRLGETLDFADELLEEEEGPRLLPEKTEAPDSDPGTELHLPKNHNCGNLDDTAFPKFFDAAMCHGTCDHKQQRGRPCFWPPATAHQCDYFRNAKAKERA